MALCRAVTLWRLFLICGVRCTIYDLRFTRYKGISTTAEVLPWMQGIPLLTAFAAEWRGPPEGTGGDGRRGKRLRQRYAPPRRPSPPSSPRLRRTIPRNAPALSGISSRCTTYDLRFAIYDLRGASSRHHTALLRRLCGSTKLLPLQGCLRKVSSLKSKTQFFILNSRYGSINRKYASV